MKLRPAPLPFSEDEAGFAIIASDTRQIPMLVISNEGNFNIADTIGNIALKSIIQSIEIGIIGPTPIDTTIIGPGIGDIELPINKSIIPMLHPNVRKWGYGEPFKLRKACSLN